MAPPSKAARSQLIRAPSCSNFQMDAPAKPVRRNKHGLGKHLGGDIQKPQRSSATVTGALHGTNEALRKMERRPKPRKKNGASSVVPMSTSAKLKEKELEKEADDVGVRRKPGFSNNIEDLVAEEDEDTKELAEELMGFLTASQHARRASMSDIPSTHGPSDGGNKGKSKTGVRRHSLSSVSTEDAGAESEKKGSQGASKRTAMERLLDQKPVGKPGVKKRDAQSVIVGRTPNPHSRSLRSKAKTSDDIDHKGHKGSAPSRPGSGKSPNDSFTKDGASGPKHSANPYGKKSVFGTSEGAPKEESEGVQNGHAIKKTSSEMTKKKPGPPRGGNRPRPSQAPQPRRNHPPGKSPRIRATTSRRPSADRSKPLPRASPTSVIISGATPSKEGKRPSLDSKIVKEKPSPTVQNGFKSDEVSLSSHMDDNNGAAGVAAQLNFLSNDGRNGDIGVKYNDVVSVLGESWRHM